jgi:hypothetical protein
MSHIPSSANSNLHQLNQQENTYTEQTRQGPTLLIMLRIYPIP